MASPFLTFPFCYESTIRNSKVQPDTRAEILTRCVLYSVIINNRSRIMKNVPIDRMRAALVAAGVNPALISEVVSQCAKPQVDAAWDAVLTPLLQTLRVTTNARQRWRTNRAPVYAAYVQLMERVKAEITHAMRTYQTPNEAAKAAAERNAARTLAGKLPLGECGAHWSTWVPPHIREATCTAFETLYADEHTSGKHPGRRITPFSTHTQRGDTVRKWEALLEQLRPHLEAGFDIHPSYLESSTRGLPPEHAEHLAHALAKVHKERYRAAYAARKTIREHMTRMTANFIVPLHWTHVLTDDARAHLRAAERAAGGDGYTRSVGLFGSTVPEFTPPTEEDYMNLDTTPLGPDSMGYVAPRPADRYTALAARATQAEREGQYKAALALAQGDEEVARRMISEDL